MVIFVSCQPQALRGLNRTGSSALGRARKGTPRAACNPPNILNISNIGSHTQTYNEGTGKRQARDRQYRSSEPLPVCPSVRPAFCLCLVFSAHLQANYEVSSALVGRRWSNPLCGIRAIRWAKATDLHMRTPPSLRFLSVFFFLDGVSRPHCFDASSPAGSV